MPLRLALIVCAVACWPGGGRAAVVVVANRTGGEVRFALAPAQGPARPYAVASGDLAAIPVTAAAEVAFDSGSGPRRYRVEPNSAYYFADFGTGLDLKEIGLTGGPDHPRHPAAEAPATAAGAAPQPRVLTVKILVDQKEPAVRQAWEKRVRGRVAAASRVLEHVCRVSLRVVAAEEWQSDDAAADLPALLADFERRVRPDPARLAIGFTSQRVADRGDRRVGATRMALHGHILLR